MLCMCWSTVPWSKDGLCAIVIHPVTEIPIKMDWWASPIFWAMMKDTISHIPSKVEFFASLYTYKYRCKHRYRYRYKCRYTSHLPPYLPISSHVISPSTTRSTARKKLLWVSWVSRPLAPGGCRPRPWSRRSNAPSCWCDSPATVALAGGPGRRINNRTIMTLRVMCVYIYIQLLVN